MISVPSSCPPCLDAGVNTEVKRIHKVHETKQLLVPQKPKNPLMHKRIGQSSDAKNVRKDGNRYGI